jgi:hypothetical protein
MSDQESKRASFSRFGISVGVVVQGLCVVFLVIAANYVGFNYYERWDFSRSQKFSLADQTKRVLRALEKPVTITVFFSPSAFAIESGLYRDVENLLKEFQFSGRKKIEVERIDPARDLARALDLKAKYKFGDNENLVIIEYGGLTKFVPITDMGEFDTTPMMMGEQPRLVAFKGEEALTSALMGLLNPEQRTVYFLQGHREPTLEGENSPISTIVEKFTRQNVSVKPLNLGALDAVPEDASVVAIIGPDVDLSAREIELLGRYWERQGRLIVLLNPDAQTPELAKFLERQGVRPEDNRVLRLVQIAGIKGITFVDKANVEATFLPGSAITKRLKDTNALFAGASQSLRFDERRAGREDIKLTPLVQALDGFWGESDYVIDEEKGAAFDQEKDVVTPIIAAAVEKGAVADASVDVAASKMVVVGNKEFVLNQQLNAPNLDFLILTLNWMLPERSKLTGVAPKTVKTLALNLTEAQIGGIAFYTMVLIPCAVAALGIFVAWRRRT